MAQVKYHINSRGEAGPCRAVSNCPFGSKEDHYGSAQEARQAYEEKMESTETILPPPDDDEWLEQPLASEDGERPSSIHPPPRQRGGRTPPKPRRKFNGKKAAFVAASVGAGYVVMGPVGGALAGYAANKSYPAIAKGLISADKLISNGMNNWQSSSKVTKALVVAAGIGTVTSGPLAGGALLGAAFINHHYRSKIHEGFGVLGEKWKSSSRTKKAILVGSVGMAATTSAPLLFVGIGAWTAKSIWDVRVPTPDKI
jgi:hypothetical protein